MSDESNLASVAAAGDGIGRRIARQMHTTFRAILRGPGAFGDERCAGIVTGEPHPFGNIVVITDLDDVGTTRSALGPLLEFDGPAAAAYTGGPVHDDVVAHLERAGFVHADDMPAMAVDIGRLAETTLPDGCTFERTARGPTADAWTECLAVGYELPLDVAALFSPNAIGCGTEPDAPFQFFAVSRDGRPVCTTMLHLADGVAGIYCVATIPAERGRGLGAHATAEPLRIAATLGYRVGVLQSSPAGHGVYRRLGFVDHGALPMYVREGGKA